MPEKDWNMTYEDAKAIMLAAVASANRHKVPGAIAIVDRGGHLMLLERLPKTMTSAADIAIGKAATAVGFQRPTRAIEEVILQGRFPMLMLNNVTSYGYVPLLGGHPVVFENEIIGGIAVAGTMDAKMDDIVAEEALQKWLK